MVQDEISCRFSKPPRVSKDSYTYVYMYLYLTFAKKSRPVSRDSWQMVARASKPAVYTPGSGLFGTLRFVSIVYCFAAKWYLTCPGSLVSGSWIMSILRTQQAGWVWWNVKLRQLLKRNQGDWQRQVSISVRKVLAFSKLPHFHSYRFH